MAINNLRRDSEPYKKIVLNCLHRSDVGGAHKRVAWVNNLLKYDEIETIVLFPQDRYVEYEFFLRKNKIRFIRHVMPPLRKSFLHILFFLTTFPLSVLLLANTIKKYSVNIVHINGATNLQPLVAALITSRKIVWHWNDTLTPKWFVKLITFALRLPSITFVVATPFIFQYYSLQKESGYVLPAPLPDQKSENKSYYIPLRKQLHLGKKTKIIGYVSHLVAAKGALDFVRAALKVIEHYNGLLHIVLIGGALPRHKAFFKNLQREIRQHSILANKVHLLGHQEDVLNYMKEFDVFVFPSWSEACPIVVLQAMEAGRPIVATNVGDVPYMLAKTGALLVECKDIDAIAQGIEKLLMLSGEEQKMMARKMHYNLYRKYTLKQISELHIQLYRCIAK